MESVSYLYKKKGSVKQIRHRFVRCKIPISSLNIPRVKKKEFAEALDRRENIHFAISCKRLVIFRHHIRTGLLRGHPIWERFRFPTHVMAFIKKEVGELHLRVIWSAHGLRYV